VGVREVQERAVMMMMMMMIIIIIIIIIIPILYGRKDRSNALFYSKLFLRGVDGVCDTHLEKILFMKKYLFYEKRLLQISDFQEQQWQQHASVYLSHEVSGYL